MKIEVAESPIPAAKQLLEHIRGLDETIPDWCEKKGLDRLKVQKAINGDITRIDVNFAVDVENASGGAVKAEDWYVTPEVGAEIRRIREERLHAAKGAA